MNNTWSKQLPTEDGYYWYREGGDTDVIRYDVELGWLSRTGSDIPWTKHEEEDRIYSLPPIKGEFFYPKLQAPK